MDKIKTYRVAIHEAGHAVMALQEVVAIKKATIVAGADSRGHVEYGLEGRNPLSMALIGLAGIMAESLLIPGTLPGGAGQEVMQALQTIKLIADANGEDRKALLVTCRDCVADTLTAHHGDVLVVAAALSGLTQSFEIEGRVFVAAD